MEQRAYCRVASRSSGDGTLCLRDWMQQIELPSVEQRRLRFERGPQQIFHRIVSWRQTSIGPECR
jgi:hypothetical protein